MKKITTLISALVLTAFGWQTNAQVLNQAATWPNAGWTLSGNYTPGALLSDPTLTTNFSFDDDAAGSPSTDTVMAESPIIDLAAAHSAGETLLNVSYNYNYNLGDQLRLEYFDADGGVWATWEGILDNSNSTSSYCAAIAGSDIVSADLDILNFTATQLSGFKYRFFYESSSTWGWGWCISSPTITSVAPPACPLPDGLTASAITATSADLVWTENGSATSWEIEWGIVGFGQGTGTALVTGTNPHNLSTLSPATNYDYYVRAICTAPDSSAWVGPYTFTTTVSCFAPTSLTASNITLSSADLAWTEGGSATSWEVEWDTTGFTLGAGNSAVTATNPHPLTGLSASTGYDYYVRAICGAADSSLWSGPYTFATLCAVYAPAHIETFSTFVPNCWSLAGDGTPLTGPTGIGATSWYAGSFLNAGGANDAVKINLYNTGDEEWIISPVFDLSAGGWELAINCGMTAWNSTASINMGSDDTVQVLLTVDNGTTWTPIYTWDVNNQPTNTGTFTRIDLAAYTAANSQFAIWATEGAVDNTEDLDFFINDFEIRIPPTCYTPSGLATANLMGTSADLSWVENGSATSWEVEWDTTGFTPGTGTAFTTGTNPYNLTGLATTTSYDYYVRAICTAPDSSSWAGPFTFTTTVSCVAPSALTAINITSTSVDLDWTENSAAISWEIQWDTAGFTPGTGTALLTGTNPHSLSGLTPATSYDYYVRAICGSADSSLWAGPLNFATECSVLTPAYMENFSTYLPGCWNMAGTGTPLTGYGSLGTSEWYASSFLNAGGANDAVVVNLYNLGSEEWLISPTFDLSAGGWELYINAGMTAWNSTGPENMGSDDTVQVLMTIDNGTTWTPIYTWDVNNQPTNSATSTIIDLSAYTGASNKFAIWATEGAIDDAEDVDFFISEFEIRVPPTCASPTALTSMNIATTSVDLAWTENGSATSWEIEWDTAGFTPGTGTSIITGTNPHSLSSLSAFTAYDFYVRAICAPGDTSSWAPKSSFTTPIQGPIGVSCLASDTTNVLLAEFDSLGAWTGDIASSTTNGMWVLPYSGSTPSTSTGPTGAYSGSNYAYYESSGSTTDTSSLVTPAIDLSNALNEAELSFWMFAYGADMSTLTVGVSTSATGPFTTVASYAGALQNSNADAWQNAGVNLDTYLGQTIYIEFSYFGTGGFNGDMAIDLVKVETCTLPAVCTVDLGVDTNICAQDSITLDAGAGSYTYTWEIDGVLTTDVTQMIVLDTNTLGGNGTYSVVVNITDTSSTCTSSDTISIVYSTCAGVNTLSDNVSLTIYPNPNKGVFTLNVNTTDVKELTIKVMNLQGQTVYSKNNFDNITNVNEQIDLSNNAKGIYFINVTSDKGVKTHKVIVQ
jgi:hypothetical protein